MIQTLNPKARCTLLRLPILERPRLRTSLDAGRRNTHKPSYMYICVCMYIYTDMYTHVYTSLCVHVCMHVGYHMYVCMHACMHACMCVCMYVYVCTYVCTHVCSCFLIGWFVRSHEHKNLCHTRFDMCASICI